jgi:hypothetical protein
MLGTFRRRAVATCGRPRLPAKVKADKISDPNEVFYVELYDAKGGATIVRARATGTRSSTGDQLNR